MTRAWEQEHELAARWKQVEYPKIHAEAQATGASIFFGDEASVRTDFHFDTTWAPVGQTPVVRGTGNRKSMNMISAVSAQGRLHFSFLDGTTTSATFIEFCKQLLHDIDGTVFLVVDGHGAHKSAATREYVESTEDLPPPALLTPNRVSTAISSNSTAVTIPSAPLPPRSPQNSARFAAGVTRRNSPSPVTTSKAVTRSLPQPKARETGDTPPPVR